MAIIISFCCVDFLLHKLTLFQTLLREEQMDTSAHTYSENGIYSQSCTEKDTYAIRRSELGHKILQGHHHCFHRSIEFSLHCVMSCSVHVFSCGRVVLFAVTSSSSCGHNGCRCSLLFLQNEGRAEVKRRLP